MKILMLVNPASHGGRGIKKLPSLRKFLKEENINFQEIILSSSDEAFERAKNLDTALYDAVAAVGGDGTIRAVGAGILEHVDPQIKMGVLYTGTSPDFCRFHGIPLDLQKAVRCLKECHTKSVPVLTANGTAFFCSCNPGMGAEIAAKANSYRPILGDFLGTLAAVLTTLLRNPSYEFKINGTPVRCNHLLVSRMPYIAGGLKLVLPPLEDDVFSLWKLQDVSHLQWLKILYRLYRRKPCGSWQMFSPPLVIDSDTPGIPLEYDGDPHGTLPVEIKFHPRRLNLIVPSGANENE